MAEIIDFPTERIKNIIWLEQVFAPLEDKHLALVCCRHLMLKEGFSAREAVSGALEMISMGK